MKILESVISTIIVRIKITWSLITSISAQKHVGSYYLDHKG